MSELTFNTRPTFGGHEKFSFRDGWLKKGVEAVTNDPTVFTHDDALVVLGVGKNMVRSIRHWCLATELVQEDGQGRTRPVSLTTLGMRLMMEDGWDPYLEDTATLWLLHWQLASNRTRSLVWYLAFSHFYEPEFTKRSLAAFIQKQFERLSVSTTQQMIEREVDCFLRTYAPSVASNRLAEESFECPLTELDLIRFIPQDNVYRFNSGPKPTLPTEVFGYGLMHFLNPLAQHRRTIAVDECLYHSGSPGQIFRLDENSTISYIEALTDLTKGKIRLQETAGLQQIYIDAEPAEFFQQTADQLLEGYYE